MAPEDLADGAATGGAAGLSVLGSFAGLCCVAPWAVALLGVNGAVFIARLEPYRLWILTAAALSLVWAFWRLYRPQPECADGRCAKRQAPLLKTALWITAAMLILSFFARDLALLIMGPQPLGD